MLDWIAIMIRYLLKKGGFLLLSLWLVVTLTFFLMHMIPGDPFIGERVIPQEVLDSLYAHYGLDQPLWIQYLKYLKGLLHGELGPSIVYPGRSVNQFIKEGFPISAQLGIQALSIALPLGVFLGTFAAMRRGKWQDHALMALSTLGVSVPSFVLSPLFQYLFSVKLHWLPVARWEGFEHTILPTLALSALPTAFIARLTRSNMVEVLGKDFIKTALAKGLPPTRVALTHGLKNALLPVLTYIGPVASSILTGSFIIEKIFAIPGLGQWMILSISGRDYPMIMGLTVFFSSFLMVSVFLVDLFYKALDPRIEIGEKALV